MNDHDTRTIGQRLVFAREQRGLSAAELRRALADRGLKVSRSRLWNYENRPDAVPKPDILAAIAAITGFNAGWLLTGEGPLSGAALADALAQAGLSGADADAERLAREDDLARVLAAWPRLTARQRQVLLQVIDLLVDGSEPPLS